MALRIGNQTNCHVPARLPFEFAMSQQFDAFEWFSDRGRAGWCEADMNAAARAELRQLAQEKGILFSVHVPVAADPVSLRGADAIRTSLDFAADVGAEIVNVHLFPQHPARVFAESLIPLIKRVAGTSIRLSLENTPEASPDHFNAVFGVLSAMPESRDLVGMCFDMGHANLNASTRNDYVKYLDQLGDHVPIIHWHAHENWGDRDSHLPLFTGVSAHDDGGLRTLVQRLLRRGFRGSVVMEQWPNPPELLVEARNRLRALFAELSGTGLRLVYR